MRFEIIRFGFFTHPRKVFWSYLSAPLFSLCFSQLVFLVLCSVFVVQSFLCFLSVCPVLVNLFSSFSVCSVFVVQSFLCFLSVSPVLVTLFFSFSVLFGFCCSVLPVFSFLSVFVSKIIPKTLSERWSKSYYSWSFLWVCNES